MGASGDTLLRRLRRSGQAPSSTSSPRVLGVDEWAWKKRQRYGTILVDLEQGRVVDLLPDRSADSFAAWLQARATIEVISRDRCGLYAEGAARGAPEAVQVADRWHLLRNLTDAIERLLEERAATLRQVRVPVVETPAELSDPQQPEDVPAERPLSRAEQRKASNRAQRLDRYNTVAGLRARGLRLETIAREVGRSERTIRRWLNNSAFPERKERPATPSKLDPHRSYLERRWREGCRHAAQLWRELRERGFDGSASTVRCYVRHLRSGSGSIVAEQRKRPTLRRTAWLLSAEEDERRRMR